MASHRTFAQEDLYPFRYNDAAGRHPSEGHIYVLQFASGVVKVGYTATPQSRITQHAVSAAPHGGVIVAAWLSAPHINAQANETQIISFCRAHNATQIGQEYFTAIDFAKVVGHAESLRFGRFSPGSGPAHTQAVTDRVGSRVVSKSGRLTLRQACAELRCSRWTLDRIFKAGKLHKLTQGRNVYVDATELQAYISLRSGGNVQYATKADLAELQERYEKLVAATAELIGAGHVA